MMQLFWGTILRSCFVSSLMVIIFMSLAAPLSALSIRQNNQPAIPFDFLSPATVPNGQALGDISFNGGGATPYNQHEYDATPNNLQFANALGLNGVPSTSSDQSWRNDFGIEETPILPVSQPVPDIFAINVGGASTSQPLADTTKPQNLEGVLENQQSGSEDLEPGNSDESSSVKPHDPCDPLDLQNAKLRPRLNADVDCGKKKNPQDTPPGQGFGALPPARKYKLPRPGTQLQKPVLPKGSPESDLSDTECFRYTLGILPLGVCNSGNPAQTGVSAYTYKGIRFFILYDATLVGGAVCPEPTQKYCCYTYDADTGIADICQQLRALKLTAPPGV